MCEKCMYCYKPLTNGETDYHARCSRKIFGTPTAPILPYKRSEIRELAKQVIRAQTTLTGVQPKLSLDFERMSHTPKRFIIVGLWGRFILKPQTETYPHLPELEDLTMHLADHARIETVPHSLIRFSDGELCYTHDASTAPIRERKSRWRTCASFPNVSRRTSTKAPTSASPNSYRNIVPCPNWTW